MLDGLRRAKKINTSYFLRLGRSNYNNKHIEQLIDSNEDIVTEPQKILKMEKDFYQDLYDDKIGNKDDLKESEKLFFENLNLPKLSEGDKTKCEKYLSESELLKALKMMKNGRSPGSDGLVTEFYKFFWIDIKSLLLSSLNYDLATGKLSIEKRRGIITLIPKKDKKEHFF